MKKVIFTLNLNNYAPEIRALTLPLLKRWAFKIGATIHEITEPMFPAWPTTYQKLGIWFLARDLHAEGIVYIDSDAAIHPDMHDVLEYLPRDTVCHNGHDFAGQRWKQDDYFRRDGRNISSANWFAVASNWCLDLWHPIDDLTPEQAIANIFPINAEMKYADEDGTPTCRADHLIDDYALSRNIAKFGLKFETLIAMNQRLGLGQVGYMAHNYSWTRRQKAVELKKIIGEWGIPIDPRFDEIEREQLARELVSV